MLSDQPYLQSWRPVYELSSAVLWFTSMNTALCLSFFSPLPLSGFLATASVCAGMTVLRLGQALPRWQQHRRLKGQSLSFLALNPQQCLKLQQDNEQKGLWLGWGFEWQREHGQKAWDLMKSDNMPAKLQNSMGAHWIHGMADHEQPLFQPLEQVQMHTMVIGVPGSGKTRLFDLLVTQAVLRGEPVIIIDPKGDHDLASHTQRSCELSGQRQRFMKFHPGFPAESVRINLLQHFNRSSELASRIAGLMPSSGNNAPFQAFAQKAVDAVVQGYLLCGQRPTLVLIRQGLESGVTKLLIRALTMVCTQHQAQAEKAVAQQAKQPQPKNQRQPSSKSEQLAKAWINYYRDEIMPEHPCTDVEGLISLFEHDRAHYSKMIATLLPILGMLTGGALADLLSPDPTNINDHRPCTQTTALVEQQKVMYFGLDSLSDPMVGKSIGQLLLADLAAVAGDRYNYSMQEGEKQAKPINLFVDEAAEVLCPQLLSLLNKGRGAKFRCYVATQTLADFEAQLGSEAAAQQFIDNCNHLICLRTQNPETQKFITDKLPPVRYRYFIRNQGVSTDANRPMEFTGNLSEQQLEETGDLFPPQLLGELPNLEYIARLGGGRLLKARIPILTEPQH
ncbi:conjugative transfer system coupling protein TraD [Endozoicomonas gorgoniicola]|uniref:Conjugative transfer system coupling protein TraD n=1 Tax=Endozoicomonas gorgoniicola TaxID=1234144 RepID=A0ABT3MTZ5_9GAMM|nr:conjugative transfer system coupling protein TraD [Endozoicomonas gorgoniicola]MCW7552844.1 conjugative transfer system coupling protein TraD [Endozoicomonas gorgoniicola]